MTADGWRCPECGVILAPAVTEHRCDPPAAGVLAFRPKPGSPPDLETATEVLHGKTVTIKVNLDSSSRGDVKLTSQQIKSLTGQVQAALLRQAQRNRRTGLQLPGYAA